MEAEIAGFLGTLVGACVSILTTFLSNKHAISLQSSADAIERQENARAFQRDNLLACQEMVQALARLTARAFHDDAMALRKGIAWGKNQLSDQLDEDLGVGKRRFAMLVERVENDELRNELKSVGGLLNNVLMERSYEAAEGALNIGVAGSQNVMELLGTVLRKTY